MNLFEAYTTVADPSNASSGRSRGDARTSPKTAALTPNGWAVVDKATADAMPKFIPLVGWIDSGYVINRKAGYQPEDGDSCDGVWKVESEASYNARISSVLKVNDASIGDGEEIVFDAAFTQHGIVYAGTNRFRSLDPRGHAPIRTVDTGRLRIVAYVVDSQIASVVTDGTQTFLRTHGFIGYPEGALLSMIVPELVAFLSTRHHRGVDPAEAAEAA